MGTDASRVQMVSGLSGRAQCWVESLILALGGPSAIWVVSKVISLSFPAVVHGSPEQRFLAWLSGGRNRRVAVCDRALVCIAEPRALLQRSRSLGLGNMASVGRRTPVGSAFCRQQSPVSAPNAHSDLIRVLAAWNSPLCCAGYGHHSWILRRSPLSRLSNDRIR